jgi:GNAT superfamily N-acetyltransferase
MSLPGRVTNLFLPEPEVNRLLEAGEMEALQCPGALFLLRQVHDFRRLYFAAESVEALAALRLPPGECMTDVVGKAADIEPVVAAVSQAGFAPYKEFQRMARGPQPAAASSNASPATALATGDQARHIHALIHQYFDPRAEHLPSLDEVDAAIRQNSILIATSGDAIAALLFHVTTPVTSTLRYWLALPEFRGRGHARALLDRYLAECAHCRRFLLWVQRDNHHAIAQYEHAGYRPDGLLDRILRKPL